MSAQLSDGQRLVENGSKALQICKRAGNLVFATGLLGELSAPNTLSVAPVKRQANAIFRILAKEAEALGASLDNTLSLQQYITSRNLAPAYGEARLQHFPQGAPTSTSIACSCVGAPDAVVQVDAILAIPSERHAIRREAGSHPVAGYSHAISFGDWVFCSGVLASAVPTGSIYESGASTAVAKEARLDPNYWFGFAIKSEIQFILGKKLTAILERVDSGVDDIAFAHVHLLQAERDLAPFIEVWSQLCPRAVTVVSSAQGYGAFGACAEVTTIAMRRGGQLELTPLDVSVERPFTLGPVAGRVGDLVFTTTLAAADEHGLLAAARVPRSREYFEQQTSREMNMILDQIDRICAVARGRLQDVVRLRLYLSSMAHAPAAVGAIQARCTGSIPFSLVEDSSLPLWMGGCTVTADAIACIP